MSGPGPVRQRVRVLNEQGLHARPAVVLAERARKFSADVVLVAVEGAGESGQRVDAKNAVDVLLLGASPGAVLEVEAVGPDAETAVRVIAELFAACFGTESGRNER